MRSSALDALTCLGEAAVTTATAGHVLLLLYTWCVRTVTYFLPDAPVLMRFRGWLYSLGMRRAGPNLQIAHNVVLTAPETIEVGRNVYVGNGCVILGGGRIVIGNNVLVGPMSLITASNHAFNGTNCIGGVRCGSVIIGDDSWVGGHCAILMGTHVRESSIVGAGSICNKDYGDGRVLVAGNPARVRKRLTSAGQHESARSSTAVVAGT